MRTLVSGDRLWNCRDLAADVLRRLVHGYGPDIIVVRNGGCGVDRAFSLAARELGVTTEYHAVDFAHVADHRFHQREMLSPGAGLCLIFGRTALAERLKDLASQAIAAAVPTCLIGGEPATPRRLRRDSKPMA
jgi:hypothetical protein